eukprot:Selendium_serpulae@DN6492_c2_g1_i4.p2
MDPTDQWGKIVEVVKRRNLLALLDCAYQGYASGDLEKDARVIRMFERAGLQCIVCQSFAKNMGLYGERMGMFHLIAKDQAEADRVMSTVKVCARANYSNPPIHGAHIVSRILGDPTKAQQWQTELKSMADRIGAVRSLLRTEIEKLKTPGDWSHITNQIGMFSFTGLSPEQSKQMTDKHHVYMLTNGRISLAGLNQKNTAHVAAAIDDVVRNVK